MNARRPRRRDAGTGATRTPSPARDSRPAISPAARTPDSATSQPAASSTVVAGRAHQHGEHVAAE